MTRVLPVLLLASFTLLGLASLTLLGVGVARADAPAQFAAPGVRAPDDPNVSGFRFSLFHGRNASVRGFDLGLLSLTETQRLSGVRIVAGLGRITRDMESGVAIGLVNVHEGNDTGLNAAFINKLHNPKNAVDVGFVNIADEETMLDIGGVNVSDRSTVQLGFINITNEIKGFQFGFVNIAKNGFLPIFPIFNFAVPEDSSSQP